MASRGDGRASSRIGNEKNEKPEGQPFLEVRSQLDRSGNGRDLVLSKRLVTDGVEGRRESIISDRQREEREAGGAAFSGGPFSARPLGQRPRPRSEQAPGDRWRRGATGEHHLGSATRRTRSRRGSLFWRSVLSSTARATAATSF